MRKKEELTNPKSCMSKAGRNEMTFVLLGRDPAAAMTVRYWCNLRIGLGKNTHDDAQIQEAHACADAMELDPYGDASPQPTSDEGTPGETPLTDAQLLIWNLDGYGMRTALGEHSLGHNGEDINRRVVLADFARTLERTLHAKERELAKANVLVDEYSDAMAESNRCGFVGTRAADVIRELDQELTETKRQLATLPSVSAAPQVKRYEFDRFVHGKLMAEGIAVHAESLEEAEKKAKALMGADTGRIELRAPQELDGSVFVQDYASTDAPPPTPRGDGGEPVAIVDAGDDGMFAEILPNVTVKVGQHLYAAPQSGKKEDGCSRRLVCTPDDCSYPSCRYPSPPASKAEGE